MKTFTKSDIILKFHDRTLDTSIKRAISDNYAINLRILRESFSEKTMMSNLLWSHPSKTSSSWRGTRILLGRRGHHVLYLVWISITLFSQYTSNRPAIVSFRTSLVGVSISWRYYIFAGENRCSISSPRQTSRSGGRKHCGKFKLQPNKIWLCIIRNYCKFLAFAT